MTNKVLLICDDSVLADLYKLNLEVYTDVRLEVKKSNLEALAYLKQDRSFQCILAKGDSVDDIPTKEIIDFLKEQGAFIPLIQLGSMEVEEDGIETVPSAYNIKHILQTVAKLTGVTAQTMAAKKVDKYYPIAKTLLSDVDTAPCDIYYKQVISADEFDFSICLNEKDKLDTVKNSSKYKEASYLFVKSNHRLKIVNLVSSKILTKLADKNLDTSERLSITEQGMEVVSANLFDNEHVSKEIAELTTSCVESSKALASAVPELSALLAKLLENKSGFAFKHSILNTYVCTYMVKRVSWGGDNHTDKLNFVLFFHDIFLVPLFNNHPDITSEEQLLYSGELSNQEKDVLLHHASLAQNALRNYPKCPIGADAIIAQHHGTTNGVGFAAHFKDDISPLAKVIIIAEDFVHRFMAHKNENMRDPFPLKENLKEMKEVFGKSSYKKLVDALEDIPL